MIKNLKKIASLALAMTIFCFSALANSQTSYAQDYQKQEILDVKLHYESGQVTLTSIEKRLGFLPDYRSQPETGYALQILNLSSRELFKVKFQFPTQIIGDDFSNPQQPTGTVQTRETVDYTVTVPIFEDAQKMLLTDPDGKKLIERDIAVVINPQIIEPRRGPFNLNQLAAVAILAIIVITGLSLYRKRQHHPVTNKQ